MKTKNSDKVEKYILRYIRNPTTHAPTGVVVATDREKLGWSLLSSKFNHDTKQDCWNREKAIMIALSRAQVEIDWTKKIKTKLSSTKIPLSNLTRTRFIWDLLPALEDIRKRSIRYFRYE